MAICCLSSSRFSLCLLVLASSFFSVNTFGQGKVYAVNVSAQTSGVGWVDNAGNAGNDNRDDFAQLNVLANGRANVELRYGGPAPAGATTFIRLDAVMSGRALDAAAIRDKLNGLISAEALNNGAVVPASCSVMEDKDHRTYLAVTPDITSAASGGGAGSPGLAGPTYGAVRVLLNNNLGTALAVVRLYYACYTRPDPLDAGVPWVTNLGEQATGKTRLMSTAVEGGSVKDPVNAVDLDPQSFSVLRSGLTPGSAVSQTICFAGLPADMSDQVHLRFSVPASTDPASFKSINLLLTNTLSNATSIRSLNELVDEEQRLLLLKGDAVDLYFHPDLPFDRLSVSVSPYSKGTADKSSYETVVKIHSVERVPEEPILVSSFLNTCEKHRAPVMIREAGGSATGSVGSGGHPAGGAGAAAVGDVAGANASPSKRMYHWYQDDGKLVQSDEKPVFTPTGPLGSGLHYYYVTATKPGIDGPESKRVKVTVKVFAHPTAPVITFNY